MFWQHIFNLHLYLSIQRSISEDSLRRYVSYASESCIQELLSASDSSREIGDDGWKVLAFENGVEISKRRSGALHVFRSRWLLQSVSPQQFITVANAIDAAKVHWYTNFESLLHYMYISNLIFIYFYWFTLKLGYNKNFRFFLLLCCVFSKVLVEIIRGIVIQFN